MAGKLTPEIQAAIKWGAGQLGISPNDLASVISFETGGTFNTNARNPNSSGTGLIQFMDAVDGKRDKLYYGMTRDQFGSLSAQDQMQYVVRYFKEKGLKPGSDIGAVYDAVTGTGYKKGSKAYDLNKVWDANGDGYIAPGESVTSGAFKAHTRDFFGLGESTPLPDPTGAYSQDVAKPVDFVNDFLKSVTAPISQPKIANDTPTILRGTTSLVAADSPAEESLFADIAALGLAPSDEPAYIQATEAVGKVKSSIEGKPLIVKDPLTERIRTLFDMVD